MALIKCKECGKEISDKATTCIHCGCPIETKNNSTNINVDYDKIEEIEIAKIKHDYDKINKHTKISLTLTIVFTILIITIPIALYCLMFYLYCKSSKNNNLILTNKRIKGTYQVMGDTLKIDLPLDKIESISTNTRWGSIEEVVITAGSTTRGTIYTLNGEDFCNKARREIDKYKKNMKLQ